MKSGIIVLALLLVALALFPLSPCSGSSGIRHNPRLTGKAMYTAMGRAWHSR